MPMSTTVQTGATLAEFGGSLYVSQRHATFGSTPRTVTDYYAGEPVQTRVVARTATLSCSCGASASWDQLHRETPTAYTYFRMHDQVVDPDDNYLTIVSTLLDRPPCDHWAPVPLTLMVET